MVLGVKLRGRKEVKTEKKERELIKEGGKV